MSPDEIDTLRTRKDGQFDRRHKRLPTTEDLRAYNQAGRDRRFLILEDWAADVIKAFTATRDTKEVS